MAPHIRIVDQIQDLVALESVWKDLFRQTPVCSPFMAWSWVFSWLQVFGKNVQPLILVFFEHDVPRALLPLRTRTQKLVWGKKLQIVEFLQSCSETCPDHLGFLGTAEAAQAAQPYIKAALFERNDWSLLDLRECRESMAWLSGGSEYHYRYAYATLPYLDLPSSWDDYLAGMGAKSRETLRRKMRQSEKLGCIFDVCEKPQIILNSFQDLFRLHRERWESKTTSFDSDSSRLFHQNLLENFQKGEKSSQDEYLPILFILRHMQQSIAALYGFYCKDTFYYYQAGRADQGKLPSAGQVLMAKVIHFSIERKWQVFDFLRGDESYKSRWTATQRHNERLIVARKSYVARLILLKIRLRQLLIVLIKKIGVKQQSHASIL